MKRKRLFSLLATALSLSPLAFAASPPLKLVQCVPLPQRDGQQAEIRV